MHYDDYKNKKSIAKEIGVSETFVARLIKEAREKGVARIKVHLPYIKELEERLKEKFPALKEMPVAKGVED